MGLWPAPAEAPPGMLTGDTGLKIVLTTPGSNSLPGVSSIPAALARRLSRVEAISTAAALGAIILGSLVLMGWILHLEPLIRLHPQGVAMKANTALGFILMGLSLWFGQRKRSQCYPCQIAARAGAALVASLGLLTLFEYGYGVDLGIDQFLLQDTTREGMQTFPGRLAPNTAASFVLLGLALLLLDVETRRQRRPADFLASAVGFFGLAALMGYAYGVTGLYAVSANFVPMAPNTAAGLCLISLGILLARPQRGLMATLTSDYAGGLVARQFLLPVACLPFLIQLSLLAVRRFGYIGEDADDAVGVILVTSAFMALLGTTAASLNRMDAARRNEEEKVMLLNAELEQRVSARTAELERANHDLMRQMAERERAENALRASEERFRITFECAGVGVALMRPDGRWLQVNQRLCDLAGYSREELLERGFQDITHSLDLTSNLESLRKLLAGEIHNHSMEKRYVRKDGSCVWANVTTVLNRNSSGEPQYFIAVIEDITERKAAQEERDRLINDSVDLLCVAGHDGFFKQVNPAFTAALGWSREELLARPWLDFLHPEDVEATRQAGAQLARGEPILRFVNRYRCTDGTYRWLSWITRPQLGTQVATATARDITEQKKGEDLLRQSEEKHRILYESARDAIMTLAPPDWKFTGGNPAAIAMFGAQDEQEFCRNGPMNVSPERQPDGQPSPVVVLGMVETAMARGSHCFEWTHRRLTGEEFPATVLLTRVQQGNELYLQATVRDITVQKKAEHQLRQLSRAVEQSPVSIVITDFAGNIEYVNPKFVEMTGYTLDEVRGRNPRILKSDTTSRAEYQRLWRAITQGDEWRGEFCNKKKNGELYWEDCSICPIVDDAGQVTHFLAVKEDITERKRMKEAVERAQGQLLLASRQAGMAEVATGVLHNVGNVVTSLNVTSTLATNMIKNSKVKNVGRVAEMLQAQEGGLAAYLSSDPKGRRLPEYLARLAEQLAQEQSALLAELEGLRKNVEHIKEIVAMQQNYARAGNSAECSNLSEVIEDALRMEADSLERRNVRILREYDRQDAEVPVEKHKVLQVLVNLLRNAKLACDDSGRDDKRVTLRVNRNNGNVRIVISDNGVGITAENMSRLFTHGFTTRKDGHGFGLHSAALGVREMGGNLQAHSDGPGMGATFTLELPVKSVS